MAKPRAKQKTEYQTSMTRSVFLYGKPNKGKYETLRHIQDVYADLANQYITALTANDDYAMQKMTRRIPLYGNWRNPSV